MQTQANSSTAVLDNTGETTAPGTREILRGENLRKTFRSGAQDVTPLAGINLTIARGETLMCVSDGMRSEPQPSRQYSRSRMDRLVGRCPRKVQRSDE